jgi:hypothetical protein
MRVIFFASLCIFAFSASAQNTKQIHTDILIKILELREVDMKLTVQDSYGANVVYMKCNEFMENCEETIPGGKSLILPLGIDSLKALNVKKFLDVKMLGLQDSIASCHFTLVGAELPEVNKSWNCNANFVLDKEKGWIITQHNCRK